MPTVAEQLRAARESKQLTIPQVAELTKIRTDHLRALEEGNFNAFSAPIYIRGSVKNYATTLKMDVPKVLGDLDAELSRTEKFAQPPSLTEESKSVLDFVMYVLSKVNAKVMMIAGGVAGGVLLICLVVVLVRHHHSGNPLAGLPPAVYQPASSGNTLPLPQHR
ncbi:MAG TPA: helix-turn-helix transcriptional regulator [Desulfuromonadaceae bacterium]|nr:helix-turn-helix transcriptional regulator [Desulfuromonadaceae bacterium]